MELRSLKRKNTMISLNSAVSLKQKPQEKIQPDDKITNVLAPTCEYKTHHAFQYLRGTYPSNTDFKKFVTLLYKGLHYGMKVLKTPSESQIKKKKKIRLPQPINRGNKKILFLDLDQTLIHSQKEGSEKYHAVEVKISTQKRKFHFNVRPHCFQFLKKMSKIYNIYVFTAATNHYAETIVNYLNKDQRTILGFLHRQNCHQASINNFIKDLRIVENRQLKDIVIVDNLAHSFGFQIENGIPILQFTDKKDDKQLLGIQQILIEMAEVNCVREYLKNKLALKKILNFKESLYINVENYFSA